MNQIFYETIKSNISEKSTITTYIFCFFLLSSIHLYQSQQQEGEKLIGGKGDSELVEMSDCNCQNSPPGGIINIAQNNKSQDEDVSEADF